MEEQHDVAVGDFEKSPSIAELAKALAAAQAEIKNAPKDSANPFFKSSYADLATITDVCRDPLARHGIARYQAPVAKDGAVGVRTMLMHASGEWVASTLWCKPKDDGPQALGSVITYLRRYSLAAAVGIAQEDDDAEGAEGRGRGGPPMPADERKLIGKARKAEPAPKPTPSSPPPATTSTTTGSASPLVASIRERVKELNWESVEVAKFFADTVGKVKFSEMTEAQLAKLHAALEAKAKERAEAA